MSQLFAHSPAPCQVSVVALPAARGVLRNSGAGWRLRGRLSTDSLGSCAVTIENAVVGSRYRIEVASTGAPVAEGDVASASFAVNVPFYAAGNPTNTLRVKVRKGTAAPKYQPFQTQVTASATGALAYIAQVPDPIA